MCFKIGVLGLGVMGSALAKNFINHGVPAAVYSRDASERDRFAEHPPSGDYAIFDILDSFVNNLSRPRRVFLMITAGPAVDQVLDALAGLLQPDDIVMDGGNSWYQDTVRRHALLKERGLRYLGVGVSGGERGALEGPSMMVGGDREGWELCADILRTAAAKAGDIPCCRYMGLDGAGHYVKMVHNGIEYGILELIAEIYWLMDRALGWSNSRITECFDGWRTGKLASYLMDITVTVLGRRDDDGVPLVDKILDVAGQKGTGKWTLLEGIERGVYMPSIYEALSMRGFSARRELRRQGREMLNCTPFDAGRVTEEDLEDALYGAVLCCYSQGLELLDAASRELGWDIQLPDVVEVWKAGCIIRADMLALIGQSLNSGFNGTLLLSREFCPLKEEAALRRVSVWASASGLSLPAISASLHYYDVCRADRMPVNLIQGMRDCFGAHTFERLDKKGSFHVQWE